MQSKVVIVRGGSQTYILHVRRSIKARALAGELRNSIDWHTIPAPLSVLSRRYWATPGGHCWDCVKVEINQVHPPSPTDCLLWVYNSGRLTLIRLTSCHRFPHAPCLGEKVSVIATSATLLFHAARRACATASSRSLCRPCSRTTGNGSTEGPLTEYSSEYERLRLEIDYLDVPLVAASHATPSINYNTSPKNDHEVLELSASWIGGYHLLDSATGHLLFHHFIWIGTVDNATDNGHFSNGSLWSSEGRQGSFTRVHQNDPRCSMNSSYPKPWFLGRYVQP
jgi:hypothetical protein